MPVNINLLSDDTIARGITPPDYGKAFEGYQAGQDYAQKQALQNLFAGGLPKTPDGNVDWNKAALMALQLQGPAGLPGAIGAAKFGLISDQLRQGGSSDVANPGVPPTPGRQSSLTDQERPDLPPSIQRTASLPTPQNLSSQTITGVQRGPVEGNPALFQPTAFAPPPATVAERFNAATDANVEDPNLPAAARPMEATRIFIPGPNPEGDQTEQTPQSPTGDIGSVPGQSQTSGGLEISEANARRFEKAAADLTRRGEALDLLEPGAGAAAKARAAAYMNQVDIIRKGLVEKNALTPGEKEARGAGLPLLEMKRREEAGKLDVKDYQEQMTSINNAAQNAVSSLQKAQLGKQITQQPDFISGPLNEYGTTFQQFRNLFGEKANAAFPNESFNKITNDMLQEQIKAMGQSGVGRVLMSEVAVMQRALASLGITDVSNRALLEMTSRTYRKAIDIANVTANLPPNSQRVRQAVLAYLKTNPMFSDEERANPALLGSKEPPPQAAQWNRQQVIEWGAQNGLKPGDPFMFNGKLRAIPRSP